MLFLYNVIFGNELKTILLSSLKKQLTFSVRGSTLDVRIILTSKVDLRKREESAETLMMILN